MKALANPAEGVTFAETGPFSRQEPVANLGFAQDFTAAAFSLEKGGVSEAIQTPRGWTVLYLKDIKAPRVPEIKDVEPRVRAAVARQKQQELALQQLAAGQGRRARPWTRSRPSWAWRSRRAPSSAPRARSRGSA